VTKQALGQLPGHRVGTRPGRKVLIRTDGAGATHAFLDYLSAQRLSYSVGFTLPENTPDLLQLIPEGVWTEAYDAHDAVRDGAWVAELTDLLDLTAWPTGMRVIVRKERLHPGAQLRFGDVDGMRITAFATSTPTGGPGTQLADLELRHRRRARCEDRIRIAKDTGLRAFPLHDFAANQIWCAIVALALEITAWMQMLALTGHDARRWEPKRLRLRLFTVPAALARTGRRVLLHLAAKAPGPTSPDAPSCDCAPWPPPAKNDIPVPTTPTRPPALAPAPTRDDTRAAVTPDRQNHTLMTSTPPSPPSTDDPRKIRVRGR